MQCTGEKVRAEGLNFGSIGDLSHNGPVVE